MVLNRQPTCDSQLNPPGMSIIKEDAAEQDKSTQQAVELARDRAACHSFVSASSSS